MESEYFIFDGIKSSDMGLYNVRVEQSGFIETPYWGGADIEEEYHKGKVTPYFYGIKREPIEFTVQFALADKYMQSEEWTSQKRNKIAKWLLHNTYKPFQTCDDLGKIYYVICISEGNLNLINTKGYVELTFRCNSSFAWTPIYIENFDLSNNTTTQIIELENRSNVLKYYKPKIEIELVNNNTDVSLKNLSNGGEIFSFTGLKPNEIISIDNENEFIKSNNQLSNPFSKFNRKWLKLVYGVNRLEVTGQCKLWIKSCFPIAQ